MGPHHGGGERIGWPRLENLGYVTRASGAQDRRKVMVCITSKGSALVRRIRDEMMENLMKLMAHLTPLGKQGVVTNLHENL